MKLIVVLLCLSILTACSGSNDNNDSLVKDGVKLDGSCSPELVNDYNAFNDTYRPSAPYPYSEKLAYDQYLKRNDLCEKFRVNVNNGTVCAVLDGNLDFSTLRPACTRAVEVKTAKACDKSFMDVLIYLETLLENTEVLRLVNSNNVFAEEILKNKNSMIAACEKVQTLRVENTCLNDNYMNSRPGKGPTLGYILGKENLDSVCKYASSL